MKNLEEVLTLIDIEIIKELIKYMEKRIKAVITAEI